MSVNIHWRPASDSGKSFDGGTSSSLKRLDEVFSGEIKEEDLEKLRAMAIAADDGFYNEVADIVEQVGSIKFWGEW